jgi:hypothetical protein
MDVFNAGLGDDTIIINVSNIVALKKTGVGNRARVDGGGGIDTLKLDIYDLIVNLSVLGILYIFTISVSKTPITLNFACQAATSISTNNRGVFIATFDNISVISWRSVLLVEET